MQQDKKELFKKLDELKKEILTLRTSLNEIDEQKESWFNKKESYSSEIRKLIGAIKDDKKKRDELTQKVKEDKEERKKVNDDALAKISQIQAFNKEKEEIVKKFKIKDDPSILKEEISRLEFKIETEVMSFDKEKETMKRIKSLKKKYKESEKISGVWNNIHKLSKEINELKKKAEEAHNRVQNRAKESQKLHEEILESSKEIDELKEKEEKAFEKFIEFKTKFNEINNQLKEKLPEISKLREEADKLRQDFVKERKTKEELIIKTKEEEVQEKIRRGEKLTTEDILVFQGSKEF